MTDLYNPAIDQLTDYPFQRLRDLLGGIDAPDGFAPLIMSIGEPQHTPPTMIAEVLAQNAHLWGKYPPVAGAPDWADAVSGWLTRRYNLPTGLIDGARHLLPATGTREALFLAGNLCIGPQGPGQEKPAVLVPNPFYQVYVEAAVMAGAEPVFMPTTKDTGFLPDLDVLDAQTLDRTRLMIICSPGNPQGAVADLNYLITAIRLARRHDFVLLLDECYAEIYNDAPPPGGLEACVHMGGGHAGVFDNLLVFHSLSKRSSAAGLRSGFVAGDERLIAKFLQLRNYAAAGLGLPLQAASAALWRDEAHASENRRLYRAKFDLAEEILGKHPGFVRPDGGFFLWLDVGNGEDFARRLWAEKAVRVLPGGYVARGDGGANPGDAYVRIALVHDLATTRDALERIARVLDVN